MKVILFGASGMVGRGVLIECIESDLVSSILMVNRKTIGLVDEKVKEVIHSNFDDFSNVEHEFNGFDACFWTLGISAIGLNEEQYTQITYHYTLDVANLLSKINNSMAFCYVSGAGTDSSENGKVMWARVKGKTENELTKLFVGKAYMFRPGYIQPLKGTKSKTSWYNALYIVFKPLYPLMKAIAPDSVTTTVAIGKAMIQMAHATKPSFVLNAKEINEFSKK